MMDYSTIQARSLGPPLHPHNQWAIDEVDRLYRHLAEIHDISAAQLAKHAQWHHSEANPSPVRFTTNRRCLDGTPSATRTFPPPLVDFSPQASLRQQGTPAVPTGERVTRTAHEEPTP
jgi:hypothetical protein